ncbi:MAG: hypothetical protein SOZ59_06035 [Candidatus Limivivens sp.]|nr:hypothetical protein [Candidatus Limivivens sp.]
MKKCKKCGLPSSYQGISFDDQGVCNFCTFFEKHRETLEDLEGLEMQFRQAVERAKQEAAARNARYDCLVGLSGGKDSTYIVYQLKHTYGMRVLTFTLDNGFSTEYGRKNIENALAKLDVDHIRISVNETELRSLYSKSVRLLHNFCSVCFHLMHYYSFQVAAWNQIPLIVNGRTKGQILQSAAGERGIEPFEISHGLKEFEYQMFGRLIDRLEGRSCLDLLPDVQAEALSYFAYHDISEEETMAFLEKTIGWKRPAHGIKHADCWAHAMAEKMSLEKHGYPIRIGELAVLVRYGKMTAEEAEDILEEDRRQFSEVRPETEERFRKRIQM